MNLANKEIKKYLQDFVPKALEENEVFIKVFGRGYAKRKLFLNLNEVYTADYKNDATGEYDLSNNCITLYNEGKHLTLKDIEDNPSTAVHESVHAILKRTKLECLLFKIENGTGINEKEKNGNEVYELGRGANEGLTNWILENAGFFLNSYEDLTNLINALEIGIGQEKVMRLGKGNIKRNIKKQLDMSTLECESFLAKFDNIYNIEYDNMPSINEIKEVLNKYKNRAGLSKEEINEITTKYQDIIGGTSSYWDDIPNIKDVCEEKHIWETDIKSQVEFFQKIEEMAIKSIRDSIEEINSTIFDKYLKKEFESIIHTNYEDVDKIPIELIEKFDVFYNIMDLFRFVGVEDFKKDYELLNKEIFSGACFKLKDGIETNTLSAEKLENLVQLVRNDEDKEKFLHLVAKLTCPNNCEIAENLLNKLFALGCLGLVNEYSAVRIKAGNTEMIGYQGEGNIAMLGSYSFISSIDTDNKLPDFDFTLGETEEEQAIINDFLKLKQQVMHENPDTTIKIEERLIVVENENKQECYLITDGKILPAQIEPIEDFKLNIVETELQKEERFPTLRKQGLFSRIGETFKKYFSKEEVIESEPYYFKPIESRQVSFRNSMKDLSSYDTTKQNKTNAKEKQLTKENQGIEL